MKDKDKFFWESFFECANCHGLFRMENVHRQEDETILWCTHCHTAKLSWVEDTYGEDR